jgi:hypothetical protein
MGDGDRAAARDLSLRGVRPPVKVPGYEQERFLGHGAYGEVWVAVNPNSGRKVAIKFYTRRGGTDWAALAREVEKLRYLFSDRYVVQLFEVGWESEPPYYVMEYMENGSLEDLLRAGPIAVHDAVGYFREIAVALVHAHDKGILHCDLKPGNVLLDHDRRPRLADFGQSRLTNEMSPALGTLFYMAPEQADLTAAPDARWDVYALGAVMYRMLTGAPPHYQSAPLSEGNLEAQLAAYRKLILHAPKPDAHRKVLGVDAELASIIDRCLEPSPSKRYPNPQAVLGALDAWQLRRVRRPLLLLTGCGFGLLFLVMAAIGAYVFWTSVSTAERGVVNRAMEGNQFAARAEAQQMAMETEHRWRVLEFEAVDPRLREWLALGAVLKEDAHKETVQKLDAWLAERRAKYNQDFRKGAEASLWTAVDRGGYNRGMNPAFPQFRHQYFGYRDYFTGLGRNLDEKVNPPPAIISGPHRSVVYRRRSTKTWAVTFSVPVPGADAASGPVGVLGMSVDLKLENTPEELNRFSVLVDTRPDGNGKTGLIVRHPYMATLPADADEENLPLYYAEQLVALAKKREAGWELMPDYQDPVEREPFTGTWLAAVEPVVVRSGHDKPVDTGFLIVVQERRDEVMRPVRDLQWRLSYGALLATAFVLTLLTVLTIGMTSVLDGAPKSRVTRFLRRWAGLPTGTVGTGTAGTGTASAGGAGAMTARAGATPGTGAQDRGQRTEDRGQKPEGQIPTTDY